MSSMYAFQLSFTAVSCVPMFATSLGYTQPVPLSTPLESIIGRMKLSKRGQSAWFSGLGGWPEISEM